MKKVCVLLALAVILLTVAATAGYAWASPPEGFQRRGGDFFDHWQIARTRAFYIDGFYQITDRGFRPVIAFQSLGEQAGVAYRLGQEIAAKYPDRIRRAEAIFYLVRDRVRYTSDIDWSGREEFARNADELARTILEDGIAEGDCEDVTVLLAVMYEAAGFRSAIALVPGHTAILLYLPEYYRATAFFELDGEPGWIWAEATGRNNPLGWVPEQYLDVEIAAYEMLAETPAYEIPADSVAPLTPPPGPAIAFAGMGDRPVSSPNFFIIVGIILFVLPLIKGLVGG
jgi:hypothetical protein